MTAASLNPVMTISDWSAIWSPMTSFSLIVLAGHLLLREFD
jgi:hypothetical protein